MNRPWLKLGVTMLIAGHGGSYTNIMGLPMETVTDWLLARSVVSQISNIE